jgi:dienelactone hydrolase
MHLKSLVFVLLAASSAAAQPAPRDVDIFAQDGRTRLKATYFPAPPPSTSNRGAAARTAPAVMLMHMCVTTRQSWEPVARQLAAAGIGALTIDNRGFGESGGPRFEGGTPAVQRELNEKWPADFDAAFAWLVGQPGVDKALIGAGGASCGVDNALQLARRHQEVRSLALLAGGTDLAAMDYLTQNPWLPVFTAAADDDEYDSHAPDLMRWMAEVAGNPRNRFVGFKDGRHGTEIFGPHPELPRQITAWFVDTLLKSPARPGEAAGLKKTPISEFWELARRRGGASNAAQRFHQVHQRDPNAFLFPEFMMNQLAYERLQSGDKDGGVELFKLNAEAYPASANAQDSLADGYIARGQNDLALAAEQKCLELLPADKINEQFKAVLRQGAEQKIGKLRGKTH